MKQHSHGKYGWIFHHEEHEEHEDHEEKLAPRRVQRTMEFTGRGLEKRRFSKGVSPAGANATEKEVHSSQEIFPVWVAGWARAALSVVWLQEDRNADPAAWTLIPCRHPLLLCAMLAVFCIAGLQAQDSQSPAVFDSGFAQSENGKPKGWSFVCKNDKAQCEIVPVPGTPGQTAARICVPGVRGLDPNWWFGNRKSIPVESEQSYILSYRVKANCETRLTLNPEGWKDGKRTVRYLTEVHSFGPHEDWALVQRDFVCPDSVSELRLAFLGLAGTDLLIDDVQIRCGKLPTAPAPIPYEGSLENRVQERMDRGMVAVPCAEGTYIGWRLLAEDPKDITFNLYRSEKNASPDGTRPIDARCLNAVPLRQTTDLVDVGEAPAVGGATYFLCELRNEKEINVAACRVEVCAEGAGSYRAIPMVDPVKSIDRLGVGDLTGDGRYEFVIKHPLGSVLLYDEYDRAHASWKPSTETYKIEAYTQDGKRLWKNDLGWSIEHRNWFSPMIVHDLDGDGRAEVAVKIGEGDPRNERGRVESGPEWVAVWDGLTGKELGRAPWPSRGGFSSYNYTSRNQLAVAYLDGKTPCLIALRGTYGLMKVDAYEFCNGELRKLWSYSNLNRPRKFWGQGAHFTQCVDVDGDGRDEVVLGSAVIDDNGAPLWTTGKGHPDGLYAGEIDPSNPGLEIFYAIETRNKTAGMSVVDAATGKFLWELQTPTVHVDGLGMCADLDPRYPGLEVFGSDMQFKEHKRTLSASWFRTAKGEDLPLPKGWGYGLPTIFWDADLQKEIVRGGRVQKYRDMFNWAIPKRVGVPMDILGDWREEILQIVNNELRIHVSTIPAMDRRVCLMQDPVYRLDNAMCAQAYPRPTMLSYDPASLSPNLNLTFAKDDEETVAHVVLSAPLQHAVKGTCTLSGEGMHFVPAQFKVDLAAGQIEEKILKLESDALLTGQTSITARLEAGADSLVVRRNIGTPPAPKLALTKYPYSEAEDFVDQTGGSVHIRTAEEKTGISGHCFSHWSREGHSLAWKITVPKAGTYRPVFRYSCTNTAMRTLTIDDTPCDSQTFAPSGGFGEHVSDWHIHGAVTATGTPLQLKLTPGPHTLHMTVPGNDKGLNFDLIALMPIQP